MDTDQDKEINHGLKLLVKTSFFVFIAIVLSKVFSYSYRIIIARYFGAEVYGVFSLSMVIIGWFVAFSSLGFTEGLVRYLSFYRGKNEITKIKYLVKFSSRVLFFSTLIIALISFCFSDFISITIFHNPDLSIFLKVFSVMIPFWIFASYYVAIIKAFEKVKQQSIIEQIVQNFAKVFFLIILIFLGFNENAVVFSYFFGVFIMLLVSYFYCKLKMPKIFLKENLNTKTKKIISRSFISYSWPVMFLGVISSIFYWIDSLVIGFFKSATEVGFYNAAVPIALLIAFAPELFIHLFFPLVNREFSQKNMKFIKEISKQISKWIFMINFPIFLLMIFFPGVIINLLFGQEYLIAENALRFLLVGALISSLFIISNNLLSMIGKSRIILYDIIVATITNLILNILLVPKPIIFGIDNSLGINGAAIATLISVGIFNLLFFFQAKHYTSIIPLKRKMFNVFLASLISLMVLLFLRKLVTINLISSILLIITFFTIYVALLLLFRGFDKNDIMILQAIKKKIKVFLWKNYNFNLFSKFQ